MSLFKRYYPVLVAVLVAVLPLGMNTYWTEVAVNVGLYALLALSLNVILGQAGIFHMGHAAFYAVGAYVTAILNTHYQIPILLLIPVAGAAAALFALIVARPIIHLRGDYLLIVTIGIVEIVREGHPDVTAQDPEAGHFDPKATPENPRWYMVDVRLVRRFDPPVPRSLLRFLPEAAGMELMKTGSRLSVQPVEGEAYEAIVRLADDLAKDKAGGKA